MNKSRVHVSLCVDDLDARDDATRSDRIACYIATPEEIQQVLTLIRGIKERYREQYRADLAARHAKMTAEEIKKEAELLKQDKEDESRRERHNNRYGDAAN